MIKLCIFDMDGLLIDSERFMWSPSMNKAAAKQGFELTEEFHNTFRGMNLDYIEKYLMKHFGSKFDFDLFIKDTLENNKAYIEKGIPLRPGVLELLKYLKQHNIHMCIGTSTSRSQTLKILEIIGIKDYFEEIVCGDEVKQGKPSPEIYLTGLSKFKDVDKSEALVFEDGEPGGIASLEAGIRLILVPDLAILSDDIKSKAYRIVNNVKDIIPTINKENGI